MKRAARRIIERHALRGDHKRARIEHKLERAETEESVGELPDDTKLGFDNGYFSGANCGECPFRSECAGKSKRKVITSDGYGRGRTP